MLDDWRHALVPHAVCALDHHLRVQRGEELVIVWDETVSRALYEALRDAGSALGVRVTAVTYEAVAYRPLKEYGVFAGRSLKGPIELPRPVSAVLAACDAFVLLCSDTELLFGEDIPRALESGTRGLFMPYLDAANARRMLFTTEREVSDQAELIAAVGDRLEGSREVRVTSEEGTDLELRLGQHETLRRTGIVKPGELLFLPAGNVARVPDEGSANGVLVIDRTVCADDYKELHEPIELHIERGHVVAVEGGTEAKALRTFLRERRDERAYHLTELAVGTNPLCKFSGIGAPSEDTHVLGTVSFALGCDTHLKGITPGPAHVDMTMRWPTLLVDDAPIVIDGRMAIPTPYDREP